MVSPRPPQVGLLAGGARAARREEADAGSLEQTTRGLLRGFGLKMGETTRGRFEQRVLDLVAGHDMLGRVTRPMLRAREALRRELADLHKQTLAIAREDQCVIA